MEIFVETERLLLRELLLTDLEDMYELDSDPEVHRYLGNEPVQDKDKLKEVIQFVRQQYIDNKIGRWAVVEKRTNNFIGWAGLKYVKEETNHHINYYDLGYRLKRKHWGQGYASESALASIQYGFEKMNLKEIFAAAHVENAASNKVLTKSGFHKLETFLDDDEMHNWYKLKKEDWEKGIRS